MVTRTLVVVAFDEGLAQRIRERTGDRPGVAGRSMNGMVFVAAEGVAEDDDLEAWLDRGIVCAAIWESLVANTGWG